MCLSSHSTAACVENVTDRYQALCGYRDRSKLWQREGAEPGAQRGPEDVRPSHALQRPPRPPVQGTTFGVLTFSQSKVPLFFTRNHVYAAELDDPP